jgi:phosphatidylglycerophosphate synthase
MEIDDLKKSWDEAFPPAAMGNNIPELILMHKQSPLAILEKKTKIAIWIFPFVGILFTGAFYDHPIVRHSPAMWLLLFILFIEFLYSVFNLFVIKKMRNAQGNIRENLVIRIHLLRKVFTQFLAVYISLYVLMAILLEISMYYQVDGLFEGWHQLPALIRGIVYVIVLALIYQAKRFSQQEHFGNYLEQLKTIMGQIV